MARRRIILRRTRAQQIAEQQLENADRATLQAQAKELGIPANQSNEALREAIAKGAAE